MQTVIKNLSPYFFAASILLSINLVFFSAGLGEKELRQPDMIGNAGMSREARLFYEQTGKVTYWTNSMFSGMPTYQIYNPKPKTGIFEFIVNIFSLNFSGSLRYFLILNFAAFIGLCFLGIGPWLALIGSFSIGYATNHIGLMAAGHLTKIGTLGFIPLIMAGTYLIFTKNWKTGLVVFTLGLSGSIRMNHIQMTYHMGLILLFYVIAESISLLKAKRQNELIKSLLALFIGTTLSFFINFSQLMGLNSFAKDTMRGGAILAPTEKSRSAAITASSKKGLGWDYAMNWSEGGKDLLSLIVPGAVGGSSSEEWPVSSEIGQAISSTNDEAIAKVILPLYWGDLPITNSPDYMGILIVFTFILSLALIKGNLKWFAIFSALFLIAQSLGSNFSLLNKTLFDYFPYYNKFRTPNSILNVLSTLVPIFSMIGLYLFMKTEWTKESLLTLFKKTALPLLLFLLLLYLIGPSYFDMGSSANDALWKNKNTSIYPLLLKTRIEYLQSDTLRSMGFLVLGVLLMYYFALKKLQLKDFLLGFGLLIGVDLWLVAKRYVNASHFEANIESNYFQPRSADREILQDSTLYFRVLDLSVNTYESSFPSYFHKTIGGESPTKLRRYQDMIEYYFSKNHVGALKMMNTKYTIDKQGKVIQNHDAYGNAWFVSKIIKVRSPNQEIEAINDHDLFNTAIFLPSDFKNISLDTNYQKNGSIVLKSYSPNKLIYQSTSQTNQVAVFSEVWYGPDKGWYAHIDGKLVDHFRVNYILRGLQIPAGDHTIEFTFNPKQIASHDTVSSIFGNIFGLILLIAVGIGLNFLMKNQLVDPIIITPSDQSMKDPIGIKTKNK